MMKIAVASKKGKVADHFGHCGEFLICDIENNEIKRSEIVANPGHKPGFLPIFLADKGVNVIISGGMGMGAINIFNERNIEVVVGIVGDSENAVELPAGFFKVCWQYLPPRLMLMKNKKYLQIYGAGTF